MSSSEHEQLVCPICQKIIDSGETWILKEGYPIHVLCGDPYLQERRILIDNYSAQVRAHPQYLVSIALSMLSAVLVWVEIRKIEDSLGKGLLDYLKGAWPFSKIFETTGLGPNIATPFLLGSLSVISILFLYLAGRILYWSRMAIMAMKTTSVKKQEKTSTLGLLEDSIVEIARTKYPLVYTFFNLHPMWQKNPAWIGLAVMLYFLLTALATNHPTFWAMFNLIVILEVMFWFKRFWTEHN